MSGGKSSSSQASNQTTLQLTSDGVVAGDLFQGQNVTVSNIQEFPETVADIVKGLIETINNTVEGAGQLATDSLGQIAKNAEVQKNPETTTIKDFYPVIIAGFLSIAAIVYFTSRK